MSSNDQIAAATEELLYIVREYYNDLNGFIRDMETAIDELNDKLYRINQNWDDSNFVNFKSGVDSKVNELKIQVERAQALLSSVKETEEGFQLALSMIESD